MPVKDKEKRREIARRWAKKAYNANPEKYRKRASHWREDNPEKHKLINQQNSANQRKYNPERVRNTQLKCVYGITLNEFKEILLAQDSRCAICKADKPNGRGGWHVDHNHNTSKIRGLLCHSCNTVLGHVKDDPNHLQAMINYLIHNGG